MILNHRDIVWITELGPSRAFEIRTTEGFARYYGGNPDMEVLKAQADNRPLADAFGVEEDYEAALIIQKREGREVAFGASVEIEGRRYTIQHCANAAAWNEVSLVPE